MSEVTNNIQKKYRALLRSAGGKFTREDLKKTRMALDILTECCRGDVTITGENQAEHSLEVARIIVSELGLGVTSVVGALLAQCSGKLPYKTAELQNIFGPKITLVLTGLRDIEEAKKNTGSFRAENFLQLVLSLAEDIRVILIILGDRLEYLRKMEGAPKEEQTRIASESYFLYAPIAHRLGLYNIKSEMEDISMKYLEPDPYYEISKKLKNTTSSRNRLIREFTKPIREILDSQKIKYTIKSRTKSIHSIWQKMKKQGVEFEEVYDLFAIRIILDTGPDREKSSCWQVYSLITDLYQPNPSRLRDWISVPKSTGYESLHTTVIGPKGKWVEIQIRTRRMDEIAEKGLAAHTRYKGIKGNRNFDEWLAEMRDVLESPASAAGGVMEGVSSELASDEVFVFTPTGDLKRLRSGSTLLDFAFSIHTEVGATCVGGKVNGKTVGIRHVLKNGDKVAVATSKNQKPKQDWLSFVVTNRARSKIKSALDDELVKAASEGKDILQRRLKNWKMEFSDSVVARLISHYKVNNARDLYKSIYSGSIELLEIKNVLSEPQEEKETGVNNEDQTQARTQEPGIESVVSQKFSEYLVIQDKIEGLDYKLSQCCKPVLGDKIFGFVTITEGIKIHRTSCPNAQNMIDKYPYRIVMARWTAGEEVAAFHTVIKISGVDDHSMITRIHEVISESGATLRNFTYENKDGSFEGMVHLFVPNTNMLKGLIKKLQGIHGVLKATRYSR